MTTNDLKVYLKELLSVHTQIKRTDKLIEMAIRLGVKDFLGAYPWAFKEKNDTVSTTAAQETVDLPFDFDALISVLEHTTTSGRKLQPLSADQYDRLMPYSTSHTNDTPAYYKIFHDADEGVWKLALYPTPDASISLYIKYYTLTDSGEIPDKYVDGLVLATTKYLLLPGSQSRMAANTEFLATVERLKQVNDPMAGPVSEVLDSSSINRVRVQQWYEDP